MFITCGSVRLWVFEVPQESILFIKLLGCDKSIYDPHIQRTVSIWLRYIVILILNQGSGVLLETQIPVSDLMPYNLIHE